MHNEIDLITKNKTRICQDGYVIVDLKNAQYIKIIQDEVKSIFGFDPTELHQKNLNDQERLGINKNAQDIITQKELVKSLLIANADCFTMLLGPDVDIQSSIYLRISRPDTENDMIDWHRDTFYGNSHWEINFWFPVFPLEEGAGLLVLEGSHLQPSTNIHMIEEKNLFRKQVTKGSIASELGFQYAPKSDDVIANLDSSKVKLLSPKIGQAIFFFSHLAHRPQNTSDKTRLSIDVRIKNMFAPTNSKPGYYQPLTRGDIAQFVKKMHFLEN